MEPPEGTLNPLNPTPVKFDNFMLDVKCNGSISKEDLAENFKLDVQDTSESDPDGPFIVKQDGHIIKKPFDLSQSTRKINKEITYIPNGFTKIIYAEKKNLVKLTRPPEGIPIGCWCIKCAKIGPAGHDKGCSLPNFQSLKLTLEGFINCLYSDDKVYRTKLRDIKKVDAKKLVDQFLQEVSSSDDPDYAQIAVSINKTQKIDTNTEFLDDYDAKDISQIFTNFKYNDVRSIKGLNKDGKIDYFSGAVIAQYTEHKKNEEPKKSSIRIYEDGTFTIIPCPWDGYNLIFKVIDRISTAGYQLIPTSAMILVANGSFRLIPANVDKGINLSVLHKCFQPTSQGGNIINASNEFRTVEEFEMEDGTKRVKYFTSQGKNKFEFAISKEDRGKLTMKFIKYNKRSDTSGNYKITAQIYNTGIIQLIFSIVEEAKKIEKQNINLEYSQEDVISGENRNINDQIENQLRTIESHFNMVRDLLSEKFDLMVSMKLDIFKQKEVNKTSDKIFNVVPGLMPYRKVAKMYPGYVVDFFDPDRDFTDNYGWSSNDEERGIIIGLNEEMRSDKKKLYLYSVVKGVPMKTKIIGKKGLDKFDMNSVGKVGQPSSLPKIETIDGENGFLLEDYKGPNEDHWVIIGEPEEVTNKNLRAYKQSFEDTEPYDPGQQICKKTEKAKGGSVDLRPDPYSFSGKCPGGLNQYIDRIGVRSRKDNKFYPICKTVSNEDRSKVEDEIVNFLLNGLSEEQLEEADIDPEVEVTMYGLPIKDRYAGTFNPGTIDRGSSITFWDPDSESWLTGTLKEGSDGKIYHKTQLGADLNHTPFTIIVNDDGEEKEYIVRGEHFHPRHRENRNFEGLNNLFEDEKTRKDFLINCAKKLNLVKPEIEIAESEVKNQESVLKQLGQLTGSSTIVDIVTRVEPFIEKNIDEFTKYAYAAVIIPDNSIRSILFIQSDQSQYLIDTSNKVMKVSVDIANSAGTIIDGFITEQREFYPVDLLYLRKVAVTGDYLSGSEGRLLQLQKLVVSESNETRYANSIKIKKPLGNPHVKITKEKLGGFIGPVKPEESLLSFVKVNRKENDDVLFVPMTGKSKFMIWKHNVPNKPIVVQLLKQVDKNQWEIGLYQKIGNIVKPRRLLKEPIDLAKIKDSDNKEIRFKTNDYIKLRLNIMANGFINKINPYSNPSKVSKNESKSFEDTIIDINLIARSIDKKVFNDTQSWFFPISDPKSEIISKTLIPQDSSRLPLRMK